MDESIGWHEIAVVQATSIDEAAGLIRLSTMLARGGMACLGLTGLPPSETAVPTGWGLPLTYVRRYALFTLVGITGHRG